MLYIFNYLVKLFNNDPILFFSFIITIYLLFNNFNKLKEHFSASNASSNINENAISNITKFALLLDANGKGMEITKNGDVIFKNLTIKGSSPSTFKSLDIGIFDPTNDNFSSKMLFKDDSITSNITNSKFNVDSNGQLEVDNIIANQTNVKNNVKVNNEIKKVTLSQKGFAKVFCPKKWNKKIACSDNGVCYCYGDAIHSYKNHVPIRGCVLNGNRHNAENMGWSFCEVGREYQGKVALLNSY